MIFDTLVEGRTVRVELRGREGRYEVKLDGRDVVVDVLERGDFMSLILDGRSYDVGLEKTPEGFRVVFPDDVLHVELTQGARGDMPLGKRAHSGPSRVSAPMPGRIVRLLVAAEQTVKAGQGLVVMEAMKMENEIRAPRAGRVRETFVREGQAVEAGAPLVVLE
jgi:biotin carboxyl carrier protein